MSEEYEAPEDYMDLGARQGSRDRELIIALAAALRPSKSDSSWQKWMLALCGALAFAAVGGGVTMYGKLSAIEANQVTQARDINRLQSQVDVLVQQGRRP